MADDSSNSPTLEQIFEAHAKKEEGLEKKLEDFINGAPHDVMQALLNKFNSDDSLKSLLGVDKVENYTQLMGLLREKDYLIGKLNVLEKLADVIYKSLLDTFLGLGHEDIEAFKTMLGVTPENVDKNYMEALKETLVAQRLGISRDLIFEQLRQNGLRSEVISQLVKTIFQKFREHSNEVRMRALYKTIKDNGMEGELDSYFERQSLANYGVNIDYLKREQTLRKLALAYTHYRTLYKEKDEEKRKEAIQSIFSNYITK